MYLNERVERIINNFPETRSNTLSNCNIHGIRTSTEMLREVQRELRSKRRDTIVSHKTTVVRRRQFIIRTFPGNVTISSVHEFTPRHSVPSLPCVHRALYLKRHAEDDIVNSIVRPPVFREARVWRQSAKRSWDEQEKTVAGHLRGHGFAIFCCGQTFSRAYRVNSFPNPWIAFLPGRRGPFIGYRSVGRAQIWRASWRSATRKCHKPRIANLWPDRVRVSIRRPDGG